MNKRGQVTIFIIIALVIVVALMIFLFIRNKETVKIDVFENPQAYFKNCVQDKTDKIIQEITLSGGDIDSRISHSRSYNGKNVTYICYTSEENELCENEHPMLKEEMESEIQKKIKTEFERCFSQIKEELKNSNYNEGNLNFSVELSPGKVFFKVNKKISFTSKESLASYENFNFNINSNLYDFAKFAIKVSNQELNCTCKFDTCNADTLILTKENIGYEFSKPVYDSKGKIYVIKNSATSEEFVFAIRNCIKNI